jgi:hypothetical protein
MDGQQAIESIVRLLGSLPDESVEGLLVALDALVGVADEGLRPAAAQLQRNAAESRQGATRRGRLLRHPGSCQHAGTLRGSPFHPAEGDSGLRPTDANRTSFDELAWKIAPYRPSIGWLRSHWCDCGAELDLLDRAVRSCIATPAREGFPAWLTDLKQRSPAP